MSKKKSLLHKTMFFIIKQALRLSALFYGWLYSSTIVGGLHFGDERALLVFCVLVSLVDLGVRPVLNIVCVPLDLLSFGLVSRLVYGGCVGVLLALGFVYLPELTLSTTSLAQNVQLALAVWVYALMVLTATR